MTPRHAFPVSFAAFVIAAGLAAGSGCSKAPPPAPKAASASGTGPGVEALSPPGRVGRLADLAGSVQRFGADGWEPAVRNQPVSTGDRLATDAKGRAVVQIGSTTVRLGPSTLVIAARLDDHSVRLRLDHGELTLDVRAAALAKDYAIETADGFFVPQVPTFAHVSVEKGRSFGATWRGLLRFEARDTSQMDLKPGQRAQEWREGKSETAHFEWVAMPASPFAAQAQKEDAAETRARAGEPHVSAEVTGAADLDAIGTWQRAEGGWRWLPPVPASWAPFRDGRWAWVPPWGWTWVDNARWGFAPFHYGRWTSTGGRWAWVPGAVNAPTAATPPTFAPALVAWVAAPPDGTAGPTRPTWLPLAPGEPVFVAAAVSPPYWARLNPGIAYPHAAPATGAERLLPSGPARLANGAAKGALTMLGGDTLQPWQTVSVAGAKDAMPFAAALSTGRVSWVAPPGPPAGRGEIDGSIGAATVKVPQAASGAANR